MDSWGELDGHHSSLAVLYLAVACITFDLSPCTLAFASCSGSVHCSLMFIVHVDCTSRGTDKAYYIMSYNALSW